LFATPETAPSPKPCHGQFIQIGVVEIEEAK